MQIFDILKILTPLADPAATKIHLAGYNGKEDPIDVYLRGDFDEWQREQTRKNFERPFVLSLIALHEPHTWLFGGLHRSGPPRPHHTTNWHYPLVEIHETKELNGRLTVGFQRPGRQSYLNADRWSDALLVKEILRERVTFSRFPGFKSVLLSSAELRKIMRDQFPDWKAALSSVAGIYLISDVQSGKFYVGSATGEGGLWQRWSCYVETGHGHNVELRALLKEMGQSHVDNFHFSILEIADTHTGEREILQRESHWKSVLLTRRHGYNKN